MEGRGGGREGRVGAWGTEEKGGGRGRGGEWKGRGLVPPHDLFVRRPCTASYYQRCVTTCETVAVVHRRPCLQHLVCCSVSTGTKARYRFRIANSAYHTCRSYIQRPI